MNKSFSQCFKINRSILALPLLAVLSCNNSNFNEDTSPKDGKKVFPGVTDKIVPVRCLVKKISDATSSALRTSTTTVKSCFADEMSEYVSPVYSGSNDYSQFLRCFSKNISPPRPNDEGVCPEFYAASLPYEIDPEYKPSEETGFRCVTETFHTNEYGSFCKTNIDGSCPKDFIKVASIDPPKKGGCVFSHATVL